MSTYVLTEDDTELVLFLLADKLTRVCGALRRTRQVPSPTMCEFIRSLEQLRVNLVGVEATEREVEWADF